MNPLVCWCRVQLARAAFASALATVLYLGLAPLRAAEIRVAAGTALQPLIDRAVGGDILLLETGPYSGFTLRGRHFTEQRPLVIKAATGSHPILRGKGYEGYLVVMSDSSYVVLDGLTLEGSNQPLYCTSIEHCVFVRLDISNIGQEAIHIRGKSRYVDIRDCRIHDTGHYRDQWSEGIYIGMGQPPFEGVEHVWIEGNDIFETAHSEGINLKARSRHVTIRGNRVHDLAPGTETQHNEAAVSCEAADRSDRPGEDTDIWIEQNEIYGIRFGRWANGIQATTMGPRIVGNRVHDCAQFGLQFNDYDNGPGAFPTWVFGNTFTQCKAGEFNATKLEVKWTNPGENPNHPQSWYH